MISRILATVALAVTLGSGLVTVMPATAEAQSLLSFLFGTGMSRSMVEFSGPYRPGTIVISTAERRLYLVTADGSRALARTREAIDSMWQGVKVRG